MAAIASSPRHRLERVLFNIAFRARGRSTSKRSLPIDSQALGNSVAAGFNAVVSCMVTPRVASDLDNVQAYSLALWGEINRGMNINSLRAVAVGLLCCGCSIPNRWTDYSIVVRNDTREMITHAHVRFGEYDMPAGSIAPQASKTDRLVSVPFPSKAQVTWRSLEGKAFAEEVVVAEKLPRDFVGRVVFVIGDAGVQLVNTNFGLRAK
jgi:hypothetical protein